MLRCNLLSAHKPGYARQQFWCGNSLFSPRLSNTKLWWKILNFQTKSQHHDGMGPWDTCLAVTLRLPLGSLSSKINPCWPSASATDPGSESSGLQFSTAVSSLLEISQTNRCNRCKRKLFFFSDLRCLGNQEMLNSSDQGRGQHSFAPK